MSEFSESSRSGHGIPFGWEDAEPGELTGEPFIDDLVAWTAKQVIELDHQAEETEDQEG